MSSAISCEVCNKPSSVIVRCGKCDRGYCLLCIASPLHPCSEATAKRNEQLISQGYEPLGRDVLFPVSNTRCSCGGFFEGQFATQAEASEALDAWMSLHEGQGHSTVQRGEVE